MTKLPPASHTFHTSWGQCPRKAWHSHIARDIERVDSKELAWGRRVHEALEQHIAKGVPLPDAIKHYTDLYRFPRGYCLLAELKLGMTEQMEQCGFFADDCFARGVIDVVVLPNEMLPTSAVIIDHKTGKVREDPGELEFHALLLRVKHPKLTSIKGWYNWLAYNRMGRVHELSDTEKTFQHLKQTHDRIRQAFKLGAEAFPPRQGPLCGWCPVKQCEYNPCK